MFTACHAAILAGTDLEGASVPLQKFLQSFIIELRVLYPQEH